MSPGKFLSVLAALAGNNVRYKQNEGHNCVLPVFHWQKSQSNFLIVALKDKPKGRVWSVNSISREVLALLLVLVLVLTLLSSWLPLNLSKSWSFLALDTLWSGLWHVSVKVVVTTTLGLTRSSSKQSVLIYIYISYLSYLVTYRDVNYANHVHYLTYIAQSQNKTLLTPVTNRTWTPCHHLVIKNKTSAFHFKPWIKTDYNHYNHRVSWHSACDQADDETDWLLTLTRKTETNNLVSSYSSRSL